MPIVEWNPHCPRTRNDRYGYAAAQLCLLKNSIRTRVTYVEEAVRRIFAGGYASTDVNVFRCNEARDRMTNRSEWSSETTKDDMTAGYRSACNLNRRNTYEVLGRDRIDR